LDSPAEAIAASFEAHDLESSTIAHLSCLASTQQQLPMSFYFALAGGTMPFIRRYSTIWP
jgi:hypothetical protein